MWGLPAGGGGGPGGAGDDVFSRRHTTLNIYWNTKGKGGKGDDQDGAGGDEGGRSAGAAAAAKAQALISDKLTKAQQRMDPAGEQGIPHAPAPPRRPAVDTCPICALHAEADPALPLLPSSNVSQTGMPVLRTDVKAAPRSQTSLAPPLQSPLPAFAELIRQLGLNVDLSLLRSVRAAPSLQQRLLGSKWRAAALAGYQVDLAGKSVLSIADWKRRGGDY